MEKQKTRKVAWPTHDEVAAFAHLIWEKEGRPEGRRDDHWREAEAQLKTDYEQEMRLKRKSHHFPAP
ncbi:MAG: DUF2934 domain-containing protein [Verrucomicrobia bacterium]|nr:DUF2934 domain-containing protein [Verrucomicrobiota bacterium]